MLDKAHCMMNMEDEDEYLDFYDFSKTYENHPLLIKQTGYKSETKSADDSQIKEKPKEEDEWGSEDEESWEEVDDEGAVSTDGVKV